MNLRNRTTRGFTLVELLVVIGIIALLISVLLPVLSGVARRGRELKCQSNLRTCVQMYMTYAAENKGSLPYGWYFNRSINDRLPFNWDDAAGDGRLTTCFSLISRMSSKHYKGDDVFIPNGQSTNPENPRANHAPFLRCPEAEQVGTHICSYAVQYMAFITPWYERRTGGWPGVQYPEAIQDKPAKLNDLLPFMILVHDTAVHIPGMEQDVGYVTDGDVDGQRFIYATHPQRRYFQKTDPYGQFTTGPFASLRQHVSVGMGGSGSSTWKNIDPPTSLPEGFAGPPYQANLRFRHGKNDSINVGYADGRVEGIQAKFNADGTMKQHNIPRKAFMSKWPNGFGIQPYLHGP